MFLSPETADEDAPDGAESWDREDEPDPVEDVEEVSMAAAMEAGKNQGLATAAWAEFTEVLVGDREREEW